MEQAAFSDAEVDAAVESLSDPDRLRRAQEIVDRAAPQLQGILAQALEGGGWFGEAHDEQVRRAAGEEDPAERLRAVRTLVAEETRVGMLVGVAVGWGLAHELQATTTKE